MFPRVPLAEIAYLALYYHPNDIYQKWRRGNLVDIKVTRYDRPASDRYIIQPIDIGWKTDINDQYFCAK